MAAVKLICSVSPWAPSRRAVQNALSLVYGLRLPSQIRVAGKVDPLAYHHAHWTRHGAPLLDLLGAVIDHVQAFSTGGPDHIDNLATACNKCNGRKSAATLDKWGERPDGEADQREIWRAAALGWVFDSLCGAREAQS
jgi:5-methylcytosine-specific restriction endonuclease McrA